MRIAFVFALTILSVTHTNVVRSDNMTVAIIDFTSTDKRITAFEARLITQKLRTQLADNSQTISLIDRQHINLILEEQQIVKVGILDPEMGRSIGKLIGATYVIFGYIHYKENKYVISCNIVKSRFDKETVETLEVERVDNLFENKIIKKLSTKILTAIR